MKHLIIGLALALAACVASSPTTEPPEVDETPDTNESARSTKDVEAAPLLNSCATQSPSICSGQAIGTLCRFNPRLWCLPAQELPDGGIFCLCQSHSTI